MTKQPRRFTNPVLDTLFQVKGNQRAALLTEPFFGIPSNLFTPFAAIYMAALGLSPFQVGIITTLSLLSQMVASLFGGVVADKMGRRKSLFLFDMLCWAIPSLIWAFAQSFWWFVPAALLNGMWRISNVSYSLMLVEDARREHLVHLYSLTNIATLLAGFVSPLAYLFVRKFSIVPTMRVLYGVMFFSMVAKNVILYANSYDTTVAKRRMEETKHISVLKRLWSSHDLLGRMVQNRRIILTMALMACYLIIKNVNDNFWPLFVTDKLLIPDETLSLFSTLRSMVMLFFTMTVGTRLRLDRFKRPLVLALSLYVLVNLMYVLLPVSAIGPLALGTVMEALALSILIPLTSTLLTSALEEEERARMLSFAFMLCLLVSSPFGLLSGWLSKMDRMLPLVLSGAVALVAIWITLHLNKENEKEQASA